MELKKGFLYFLLFSLVLNAQNKYTIKGCFPQAKNRELKLEGFDVFKDTVLSQTQSDDLGNFVLSYPVEYKGAAILKIKDITSVVLLLNHENFDVNWSDLKDFNTIQFVNSPENENFEKGIIVIQQAEN